MTRYRHAIWPPSREWRNGYEWGAPVGTFKRGFPAKVKQHGAPLRVWDSETERNDEQAGDQA